METTAQDNSETLKAAAALAETNHAAHVAANTNLDNTPETSEITGRPDVAESANPEQVKHEDTTTTEDDKSDTKKIAVKEEA